MENGRWTLPHSPSDCFSDLRGSWFCLRDPFPKFFLYLELHISRNPINITPFYLNIITGVI